MDIKLKSLKMESKNIISFLIVCTLFSISVSGQGKWIYKGEKNEIRGAHVISIQEDYQGRIWVLANNENVFQEKANEGYISMYDGAKWCNFIGYPIVYDAKFSSMEFDSTGTVYLVNSSKKGPIYSYCDGHFTNIRVQFGIKKKEKIFDLQVSGDNTYWLLTSSGLWYVNNNSIKKYFEKETFATGVGVANLSNNFNDFHKGYLTLKRGVYRFQNGDFVLIKDLGITGILYSNIMEIGDKILFIKYKDVWYNKQYGSSMIGWVIYDGENWEEWDHEMAVQPILCYPHANETNNRILFSICNVNIGKILWQYTFFEADGGRFTNAGSIWLIGNNDDSYSIYNTRHIKHPEATYIIPEIMPTYKTSEVYQANGYTKQDITSKLKTDRIKQLYIGVATLDSYNRLWLGCGEEGMIRMKKTGSTEKFRNKEAGIIMYDGNKSTFYTEHEFQESLGFGSVLLDSNNNIWFGSYSNGIYLFKQD